MGFKFDFTTKSVNYYVVKRVRISFFDSDPMELTILGFTSGFDNDNGQISVEGQENPGDYTIITIYENEIKDFQVIS